VTAVTILSLPIKWDLRRVPWRQRARGYRHANPQRDLRWRPGISVPRLGYRVICTARQQAELIALGFEVALHLFEPDRKRSVDTPDGDRFSLFAAEGWPLESSVISGLRGLENPRKQRANLQNRLDLTGGVGDTVLVFRIPRTYPILWSRVL